MLPQNIPNKYYQLLIHLLLTSAVHFDDSEKMRNLFFLFGIVRISIRTCSIIFCSLYFRCSPLYVRLGFCLCIHHEEQRAHTCCGRYRRDVDLANIFDVYVASCSHFTFLVIRFRFCRTFSKQTDTTEKETIVLNDGRARIHLYSQTPAASPSLAKQMTRDCFSDNGHMANVKRKKWENPEFIESRLHFRWTREDVANCLAKL